MTRPAIYLDHNASAPLLPEARDALLAALDLTGNPSSVHGHGRALRATVDAARNKVAKLAGAERDQVVFTGSATEAITQAIIGGAKAFGVDAIVTSAAEHAAVLKAAEATATVDRQTITLRNERFDVRHCQIVPPGHPMYGADWEFAPGPPGYSGRIMVLDRH